MAKIKKIKGRQVFDSRGNPTVEAEVFLKDDHFASAIVPSGASTGKHEAFELRDLENKEYLGKSVLNAVKNINGTISKNLNNFNIFDQRKLDNTLNIWKYSPLNEAERIAGMLIPRILNS